MNAINRNKEIRYRLLKLVQENPELSQRQLAKEVGVSVGKLNFCMKGLIDIGLIKVGNFARSNHKLGYVYLLTPKGVSEKAKITSQFLAHKEAEYEALKKELSLLREEAHSQKKETTLREFT